MMEKRKFPRVSLTAKSFLRYQDANYKGQLENISLSGALVRIEQRIIVPLGGEYGLMIYIAGEDSPLQLIVEVVCSTLSLAGIKFVSCDAETAARLGQLVHNLTSEPDTLESELQKIRLHLDNYLR